MLEFVRQGQGIAIVPQHLVKDTESLQIRELTELREEWIHLATLNYEILPENVRRVRLALIGDQARHST